MLTAVRKLSANAIAERVRSQRERRGFSQAQVARHLPLSTVAYGHYERGRSPFTSEQLETLASLFGCKVSYFFGEQAEDDFLDDEAIDYYRGIAPDLKPTARALLKTLYEQSDIEETTHGKQAETEEAE